MKLTKREARFLLHHGATRPPFECAFQRILDHDWSFDPRGSNLTFLLRHFHEQKQVLYGGFWDFSRIEIDPDLSERYYQPCVLCATSITRAPYYTARNGGTFRWQICRDCHAAIHGAPASFSNASYVLLSRLRITPIAEAALRFLRFLRRCFVDRFCFPMPLERLRLIWWSLGAFSGALAMFLVVLLALPHF